MQKIEQKLLECDKCGKTTVHHRNIKKYNWLLHIFMVIITGTLWLIPLFFILLFSDKSKDKFICSSCGNIKV
jgi:hypothetical protein